MPHSTTHNVCASCTGSNVCQNFPHYPKPARYRAPQLRPLTGVPRRQRRGHHAAPHAPTAVPAPALSTRVMTMLTYNLCVQVSYLPHWYAYLKFQNARCVPKIRIYATYDCVVHTMLETYVKWSIFAGTHARTLCRVFRTERHPERSAECSFLHCPHFVHFQWHSLHTCNDSQKNTSTVVSTQGDLDGYPELQNTSTDAFEKAN